MYKVIKSFVDLQDNNHYYDASKGDIYPREGLKVSEERIAELAGKENLQGVPLIQKVDEKPKAEPKKAPAKKATPKAGK